MRLSALFLRIQKTSWLLWLCIGICLMVPFMDLLEAHLKSFSFYLSESLLFSLFWWLFIPGLFVIKLLSISSVIKYGISFLAVLAHTLLFSLLVGGLSTLFRSQGYDIQSTFTYAVLEHGISALLIYGLAFFFMRTESPTRKPLPEQKADYLWVSYRDEKVKLAIAEIRYVKTERPYLALITQDRKYLFSSSLKGFREEWATPAFVQIHKSTLINASYITSFRSRKNGDYDFFLEGNQCVRASRHFRQHYLHLISSS